MYDVEAGWCGFPAPVNHLFKGEEYSRSNNVTLLTFLFLKKGGAAMRIMRIKL
jgi:hypothetical protein